MIGFKFTLKQIANGWLLEEFSQKGPSENDQTLYFDTFEKAMEEIAAFKGMLEEHVGEK